MLRVKGFREVLKDLMDVTGLWLPFHLGTFHRYVQTKCYEVGFSFGCARPLTPAATIELLAEDLLCLVLHRGSRYRNHAGHRLCNRRSPRAPGTESIERGCGGNQQGNRIWRALPPRARSLEASDDQAEHHVGSSSHTNAVKLL